ncbi:hypothetical protein IFM89_034585, partial [Coptis chinensis]
TENGLVEAVAVLGSKMPHAWERWRGQIAKLDCSAFWVKCDHRRTGEDLKNLLKGLAGTYSLAKKCMQLKPLSNPHSLMGLILGIQGENIEVVLVSVQELLAPGELLYFSCTGFVLSNEVILELFGLDKIATHGPCNDAHQPSPLKVLNHAKWDAWQRLGDMDVEEAMCHYISIIRSYILLGQMVLPLIDMREKNKDGDYEASSSFC